MELAVAGLARRRASASASSTAATPPVDEDQVEDQREVVDRAARPRRSTSARAQLPDRQPERRAERHQRQRRHDAARARTRARSSPTMQHDASPPPSSAMSGESPAQSMCGPLTWAWRRASGHGCRVAACRRPRARVAAAAARPRSAALSTRRLGALRARTAGRARAPGSRARAARARAASPSVISRDSTLRPDAVVHRADEQRAACRRGAAPRRSKATIAIDELRLEDAEQDQELADEVRRARHRERGERDDQEQRREHRRAERDPAHVADVLRAAGPRARSSATMKNSGATTRPWLTICSSAPWAPCGSQREDPERDEAELRDRRVAERPAARRSA